VSGQTRIGKAVLPMATIAWIARYAYAETQVATVSLSFFKILDEGEGDDHGVGEPWQVRRQL
jgi:hypothetical protein